MTDKKDPGKFTIRFNICDPQHKAVIDLLNRQGRSKAQFLVSAVLHYINCKETPEVSVPVPIPDQAALEEMILAILAKNQSHLKKQPEPKSAPHSRMRLSPLRLNLCRLQMEQNWNNGLAGRMVWHRS